MLKKFLLLNSLIISLFLFFSFFQSKSYCEYVQGWEKEDFYDDFGQLIMKEGYPVFEWQTYDTISGGSSSIYKNFDRYANIFKKLIIFSDQAGSLKLRLSIGDFLYKKYSYYTFYKPRFNGVLFSLRHSKINAGFAFSRISDPVISTVNNYYAFDIVSEQESDFLVGLKIDSSSLFKNFYNINIYNYPLPVIDNKISFIFVDQYHHDSRIRENTLEGISRGVLPTTFKLKFSDKSPSDGYGAALFGYRVYVNGKLLYDYSDISTSPDYSLLSDTVKVNNHLEANGNKSFTISFTINNPENVKEVVIKLDLANDFLVQLSTGTSFEDYSYNDTTLPSDTILFAEKKVKDYSNRDIYSYRYGISTANMNIGIKGEGKFLLFKYTTEYDINIQHKQSPMTNGRGVKEKDIYTAFYIKYHSIVDPIILGGDFFWMDPFYSTSFRGYNAVDDNDDKDPYPDGDEYGPPREIPYFMDKNRDGVFDNTEMFLDFECDPYFFTFNFDRNNNEVPDNIEDDKIPDYVFKPDLTGFNIYAGYKFYKGTFIKLGYLNESKITREDLENISYYIESGISFFMLNHLLDVNMRYIFKSVRDNIVDNVTFKTDELNFTDSLYHSIKMDLKFNIIKKLYFLIISKFEINYQKEDEDYVNAGGFISKIKYDFNLGKHLIFSPMYKYLFKESNNKNNLIDKYINNILMGKMSYKLNGNITIESGIEYKFNKDFVDNTENFLKKGFLFQIKWKNTYRYIPLIVNMGFKRYSVDYDNNSEKNYIEEIIFLNLYSAI